MKIITPGVLPANHEYRAECEYCRCVFSFTYGESRFTEHRSYTEERDRVVDCPTCQKIVVVVLNGTVIQARIGVVKP